MFFGGALVMVESDGEVGQDVFMMGGELTIEGPRESKSGNPQRTGNREWIRGQDVKVDGEDLIIGRQR